MKNNNKVLIVAVIFMGLMWLPIYILGAYAHDVDMVRNYSGSGNASAWTGEIKCNQSR